MGAFLQGVFIQKKHNSIREMKKGGYIIQNSLLEILQKIEGAYHTKLTT